LEKLTEQDRSNFLSSTIFCFLVFRVMPWPKGKIKAPEAFCPPPEGDFDTERNKLLEAIREFIATAEREPRRKTLHPMFGRQTLKYWSLMHGKHFEHHFQQFGV
jgi:oxepin-CoA hydrolase/3-oxo-5,6-dehydrosuberyl-CoA semialdehyde dehydrogenase